MDSDKDMLEIGSFSIFTNVSDGQKPRISYEVATLVSAALKSYFDEKFENEPDVPYRVRIDKVATSLGCVITVMTLSVGAAGAALYKLITDYDKVKSNIRQVVKDAKWLWVKITRKKNDLKDAPAGGAVAVTVTISGPPAKDGAPEKAFGISLSGNELTTWHRTALMRDDISEYVDESNNAALKKADS